MPVPPLWLLERYEGHSQQSLEYIEITEKSRLVRAARPLLVATVAVPLAPRALRALLRVCLNVGHGYYNAPSLTYWVFAHLAPIPGSQRRPDFRPPSRAGVARCIPLGVGLGGFVTP